MKIQSLVVHIVAFPGGARGCRERDVAIDSRRFNDAKPRRRECQEALYPAAPKTQMFQVVADARPLPFAHANGDRLVHHSRGRVECRRQEWPQLASASSVSRLSLLRPSENLPRPPPSALRPWARRPHQRVEERLSRRAPVHAHRATRSLSPSPSPANTSSQYGVSTCFDPDSFGHHERATSDPTNSLTARTAKGSPHPHRGRAAFKSFEGSNIPHPPAREGRTRSRGRVLRLDATEDPHRPSRATLPEGEWRSRNTARSPTRECGDPDTPQDQQFRSRTTSTLSRQIEPC